MPAGAMIPFAQSAGKHVAMSLGAAAIKGGTKRMAEAITKKFSGEKNVTEGGIGKKAKGEQELVDTNHAQQLTYVNSGKGVSKGKKKKNAFKTKILEVLAEETPLQTHIRFHRGALTTTSNTQTGQIVLLYPMQGLAGAYDDLQRIATNMTPVNIGESSTTIGVPNNADPLATKILFTHATMELTLANTHATNMAFVNLYEIEFTKDLAISVPYSLLQQAGPHYNWENIAGAIDLTISSVGVTPFQFPAFTSRVKIVSKRVIQLPVGSNTVIQYADPRKRTLTEELLQPALGANLYCALGGWTRGYMFTVTGALDANGNYETTQTSYCALKRYQSRMIASNQTSLAQLN